MSIDDLNLLAKRLIKEQSKKKSEFDKVSLIDYVVEQLCNVEPMTDSERNEWENRVTEMVNNYC